ncbi:hypothetical protein ACFQX7_05680 [Luedemannella flava]|uniref:hypothetical protein n=1 Tax=Luedemannella flava TaxID=349316 RepID=UPI0031E197A3
MVAAGLVTALGNGGQALAADDSETVRVDVIVGVGITLNLDRNDIQLIGGPGQTVANGQPVSATVVTNNPTGYTLSVQSDRAELTPQGGGAGRIPIANLTVQAGGGSFEVISDTAPTVIHTDPDASALNGDTIVTTYRVVIPAVPNDTYQAIITYTATTT